MIKNLKKLFVCIFMLIFSSICVVNMSTFASAWSFDDESFSIGIWDPKAGWREKYFQKQRCRPVSPLEDDGSSSTSEEEAPSSVELVKLMFLASSKKIKKDFATLYNRLTGKNTNSRTTFHTTDFDLVWKLASDETKTSLLIPIIEANPSLQHYLSSQK